MTADTFELHLPPRPDHLGTARAFVGAIARDLGLAEELVADLQLAVSEACAEALEAGAPIDVRLVASTGSLEIEVGAPDRPLDLDRPEGIQRLELVRALFPDASLEESDGIRILRFAATLG